jgi:hypothetical protein
LISHSAPLIACLVASLRRCISYYSMITILQCKVRGGGRCGRLVQCIAAQQHAKTLTSWAMISHLNSFHYTGPGRCVIHPSAEKPFSAARWLLHVDLLSDRSVITVAPSSWASPPFPLLSARLVPLDPTHHSFLSFSQSLSYPIT